MGRGGKIIGLLNCSVPAVSSISSTTCRPYIQLAEVFLQHSADLNGIHPHRPRAASGTSPLSLDHSFQSIRFAQTVLLRMSARALKLGVAFFCPCGARGVDVNVPVKQLLPTPPARLTCQWGALWH